MPTEFHKGAPALNFRYSKENRKQPTQAEKVLWQHLRNRRLNGFKFRRQHPVSDFIADFYCDDCKVIDLGLKVIRFTNREVLEQMDYVLLALTDYLETSSNEKKGQV